MSLFPAYSNDSEQPGRSFSQDDKNWLENSSFFFNFQPPANTVLQIKQEKVETCRKQKKKVKKKKVKSKPKEVKVYPVQDCDSFIIDAKSSKQNLNYNSLPKSLTPRYFTKKPGLVPRQPSLKKQKVKRYFKIKIMGNKTGSLKDEEKVSKKTEEFNKKLADNPQDVDTWIDFVEFQDDFYEGLHIEYMKLNDKKRAASHRKLNILDKALSYNPESQELQKLWLTIAGEVLPSEEVSSGIEKLLQNINGSMTLWLGLMTTTQHSLARCTMPAVKQLFEKLLLNFQKTKQSDNYGRDLNVLELLFHYGRFLDQTGHWEILWTMIKVNLQFNTKIELNLHLDVDEKVKQLENSIVEKEKQAIWQMWSQLERIREGLHFFPDPNSLDYPQRCVFPETVVNFTWHFHPDLHFQLIVSFIVLLKVPLLPSTDTVLKSLSPNSLPWVFDSPEFVLASVLVSPAVDLRHEYLKPITQLSRGPQYLRMFHGQSEFLTLIRHTFEACKKCLEERKQVALGVWWLRFERWIRLLNKLNLAFLQDDVKNTKNFFKNFLKIEENRNNLLYYVEYGLFEYDLGNSESSIKILKTIISSRPPVLTINSREEKGDLTLVYRTLCEVYIGANKKKNALDLLINLGSGTSIETPVTIHLASAAEKKFRHVSIELINELDFTTSTFLEDIMLPSFVIEWISCYFWLIILMKSSTELINAYKEIFSLLDNKTGVFADKIRECLWETVMTISWAFETSLLHIRELLKQCSKSYPKNLKFSSFMSQLSARNYENWWSLKATFLSNPTSLNCISLLCIVLECFEKKKELNVNKALNVFKHISETHGRLSSMIHCLRLRYLYEREHPQLEEAQLQALEACPWNKSIYMESILLLPAKLMQLTDVLIEKELRIHITPDEIQVMRD